MEKLNKTDIQLRFLTDVPVKINGIWEFKPPKVLDIVEITETVYNQALSSILLDKDSMQLEGVDDATNLQVIMMLIHNDEEFKKYFLKGLQLHFEAKVNLMENGYVYFGEEVTEDSILEEEQFNQIVELVRVANNIQEDDEEEMEFNPGNDAARKIIEERMKKRKVSLARINAAKKKTNNLFSIISGIGFITSNLKNVLDMNIFQLYEANRRIHKIEHIRNINRGIYAGTVDGSKMKNEELDFTSIIDTSNKK